MSIPLEYALSNPKNNKNLGEHVESALSFPPVKVGINIAKIAFFPAYLGVALIANGARDENEASPPIVQRVAEIGLGTVLLLTCAWMGYATIESSYF